MKIFKFVVDDLASTLYFLELYCIRKGISYVKLADKFHFLDYIFKKRGILADLFLQEQVNSASIFFEILNCDETSDLVNESLSSTKN